MLIYNTPFKSYNAKKEINQVQSEERDKSPS